jgi:hypothetical protein
MGTQWQDASTVWHTGFDGDISLNNVFSFSIYGFYTNGYASNNLVYDETNNRIYSGGAYISTFIDNSLCFSPFVAWSNDGGINWQDASAIWQEGTGAFDYDICFNSFNYFNQVSALAYDPQNNNRIYAGGTYSSIEKPGNLVPFVCWSEDGINWQDASAIWQEGTGAFDGDISFNSNQGGSFVSSLLSYNNRIYAGGGYSSIENSGNIVPFVCSTSDGVNWQDASALWHSNAFDGDISLNIINGSSLVSSLAYDSSNNRIYAGGRYTNNSGNYAPFVCWSNDGGINWQDASAIWQNGFDGDISLNNNNNSVFSLAYNTINNRIYAGGIYSSIENSGNVAPFVCSSSDGINWQDASAIWQPLSGAFNSDICFNGIINSVNSLTYDNQGFIYAGGMYTSNKYSGSNLVPFVSSSSDGIHWQDSTAILQGFDGDIYLQLNPSNINVNLVTSLLYEPSHNRLYANGYYTSESNNLTTLPFVANGEPANPPPYYSIEFTDTVLFLNGRNSGLTTQTYYLNLADMSSNVTVTNNLSSGQVGTVKLWVDNSSQTANNVPPGQFIINGNNITIDGQCTELDLSAETGYTGLVSSVADNSTGIIIENININLGTNPAASLSGAGNSGWVCHGNMNGVEINFMNCQVSAGGDLYVNNQFSSSNGGICGGSNGTLSFTSCTVSADGNLAVGYQSIASNGGICGSSNGTLTFTNCQVSAGGDLTIDYQSLSGSNGGICGISQGTLTFTNCQVSSITNLTISYQSNSGNNSGICGSNGFLQLDITDCHVSAGGDLYVTNGGFGTNGGICQSSINATFTNCQVSANGNLTIDSQSTNGNNGGICGIGGDTLTFLNCQVSAIGNLTIEYQSTIGNNGGICGGGSYSGTSNFTNCQVQSNNDILITSPTNTSAGICGGGNDANNSNFNFFLCFVRPGTNTGFKYNGTPITAPNHDRVTLKTKLMIAGQNITNQNQIQIDCVSQLIALPDYSCNTEPLPPVPPTPPPPPTSNISPLGGGIQGFEPKMVVLVEGGGGRSMTRRILRDAFGTGANNKTRKCTTPFRISVNESCAGKPGKAAVIYSGSDYIRFKKLVAVNKNYNDSSFGGDNNNGSYDALKRARH